MSETLRSNEQRLFPHTVEEDATLDEYSAQHELAHWTLSALETVVHRTDRSDEREKYAHVINEYNEVAGETRAIVKQGVRRGFLTSEL